MIKNKISYDKKNNIYDDNGGGIILDKINKVVEDNNKTQEVFLNIDKL
jgi:hypothetical protein